MAESLNFELMNESFTQKGLKIPALDVLKLNVDLYSALLYQAIEDIAYTDEYIRIANQELAKIKFNKFFNIAIEENVELAITPEYSCPWVVIEE